ncbi:hypothetical protein AZE42_12501 [Rhizopogon vesiculosus]|uniref:Uncharacterized protein n=1 Tax=Rhizopogon vesiculosus TaxID=180088 RepID=A0A1J8QMX6_9AGAM|nr:hypothetical protein AZE42_12501 [Rhizopogon vesiculosus]
MFVGRDDAQSSPSHEYTS